MEPIKEGSLSLDRMGQHRSSACAGIRRVQAAPLLNLGGDHRLCVRRSERRCFLSGPGGLNDRWRHAWRPVGWKDTVLLDSIEVPDKTLAFGARARSSPRRWRSNFTVRVLVKRIDPHDRVVGIVILGDGRSLNEELLAAGMAWVNVSYCREGRYFDLEAQARDRRTGLWADLDPIVPSAVRSSGTTMTEVTQ